MPVEETVSKISPVWKALIVILAAMGTGAVWTQKVARINAAPELAEQTAASLLEVTKIVQSHDTAIEGRGTVIQATYDLARSNAANLGILLCMHQAEIESTDVRTCLLSRSSAREQ